MDYLERTIAPETTVRWMEKNWSLSVYGAAIYAVTVFTGRWYMQDKQAFNLRRPLVLWNVCLAAFSAIGLYKLAPALIEPLLAGGVSRSVCHTRVYTDPTLAFWTFAFTVAKMLELGDTAFIVLRKTPLSFLHWYHHISVLVYCWCFYPVGLALANWFATLNYGVHAVMYSYYALKGVGLHLPTWVSQCVTVLQMAQFIVCLVCTFYAYYLKYSGSDPDCALGTRELFYVTLAMYGSYMLLFVNFFYKRYLKRKQKPS